MNCVFNVTVSLSLRFGCLDESVFRRYTKQLLSGVSYLHNNNVIHRLVIHSHAVSTKLLLNPYMAPALRFKAKHWYFCFPLSTQIFMKNEMYNVIKIE